MSTMNQRDSLSMRIVLIIAALLMAAGPALAQAPSPGIGVVIMHGKGGTPERFVGGLASSLEEKGYLVANLEMAWSGRREYDVTVDAAAKELEAALEGLRSRGAKKLFVAGHSLGGLFALYFAGRHRVDGVIAIAPGGSVNTPMYRRNLGESVDRARRLVSEGKGNEKTAFDDYEGSRGTSRIYTTPAVYLTWFDPDGAISVLKAAKATNPAVPVLHVAPTGDYPNLSKSRDLIFGALPRHPLTRLYTPESTHLDAPFDSRDEIFRWTSDVAQNN